MSDKHTTEHVDEVMGMKQGHGKVPRFLILVYSVLAAWAVFYALTAQGIDDRKAVADQNKNQAAISVDKGKALTSTCAACHGANLKGGLGPTLYGVTAAPGKGDAYVENILKNGGATMPAIAKTSNWDDNQVKSIVEYLKTLK